MLKKARPEDCEELRRRRVELELLLLGESIGFQRRVELCKSMAGGRSNEHPRHVFIARTTPRYVGGWR
jgi:hypothetical protein